MIDENEDRDSRRRLGSDLRNALVRFFGAMETDIKAAPTADAASETADGYERALEVIVASSMEEARIAAGRSEED